MENLESKYSHIKGWGVDADPENEPTYPMKHWTGDDHKRLEYERAPQQEAKVEILHSNERPGITRVFGSPHPPQGLSGSVRRFAFRYSETRWEHWLSLILADRINMIEGLLGDFSHGKVPNVFKEAGWGAMAKHNKKLLAKTILTKVVILTAVYLFMTRNKKSKKKQAYFS